MHTNNSLSARYILNNLVGVDEVILFDERLADGCLLYVLESEVTCLC